MTTLPTRTSLCGRILTPAMLAGTLPEATGAYRASYRPGSSWHRSKRVSSQRRSWLVVSAARRVVLCQVVRWRWEELGRHLTRTASLHRLPVGVDRPLGVT
jgi:hypothetical protein